MTAISIILLSLCGCFLWTSHAFYHSPYHLHSTRTTKRTSTSSPPLLPLFVKRRKNNNINANKNRRRIKKSDDVLAIEKDLNLKGYHPVIGSDESGGGGCIAGPVVTASCCILSKDLKTYEPIEDVADSKTLTPSKRQRIFDQVVSQPELYAWKVAFRNNTQIDSSNIFVETLDCFRESIESLVVDSLLVNKTSSTSTSKSDNDENPLDDDCCCNAYSIVDGKKSPKLSNLETKIPCRPWVKGDSEVYTVSLASIIAKVTRDQLSIEWHKSFPQYGFDVHHGYATKDHIEAIHRYGPCPIHRMSFKSLKGR